MIHNRPIYHCQCCGAVITQEPHRRPPYCCGEVMFKAAEETLQDDFVQERKLEPVRRESLAGQIWAWSTPAKHFASP
jgi:hypothetical protein